MTTWKRGEEKTWKRGSRRRGRKRRAAHSNVNKEKNSEARMNMAIYQLPYRRNGISIIILRLRQ